MGQLIYSMIVSLDGYVADRQGSFDWAMPSEEVLAEVNAETVSIGTYLYGRRMYELMQVWETDPNIAGDSAGALTYAELWQQANKIVYSTQLDDVSTSRTELRRTFDPEEVRQLKTQTSDFFGVKCSAQFRTFDPEEVRQLKTQTSADLSVDGPTLAATALRHDLVDRIHQIVCPIVVGSGLSFLPELRIDLELDRHQRFDNGMMALQYRVKAAA